MKIIPFLSKRYVSIKDLVESNQLPYGAFIYLNPFNYFYLRRTPELLSKAYYRMDGIYLVGIMRLYLPKILKIQRQSFDMTSLAPVILDYCERNTEKVFVAGGKGEDANKFIQIMKDLFPGIEWVGYCDGYQSNEEIVSQILSSNADIALLGLGNIKQETVANILASENTCGRFFTCGAFISQTANSGVSEYYPKWVNDYHLRWAYRFVKEPHVIKRVIKYYPFFLIIFIIDAIKQAFNDKN